MRQLHIRIVGTVQGVFFRSETQKFARDHGITGWVQNNEDESVEILGQGEEDMLKKLLVWCWEGPPQARVDDVEEEWQEPNEKFKDFEIKN